MGKILKNNKIQVGLFWDIDGHSQEIVSISEDGKTCKITEKWITEDTWEEREITSEYNICIAENGAEYAENQKYPGCKLYANSAFNYPWIDEEVGLTPEDLDYPEDEEDEEYTPSSTFGDYGPSNPWDAPGMSIRDFI